MITGIVADQGDIVNVNTAANALLIGAAVVWILWKQIQAAPIKTRLLVAAPLVMGYFGIRDTPSSTWTSAADLTLIAVGAAFAVGLGLARGTTIRVWREQDGLLWRQGSKVTLMLWGALLVVRAAMYGVAEATGHRAASGLGPVLLSLGLSFAAQNAVTGLRISALSGTGGGDAQAWARDRVPAAGSVDLGQYAQTQAPVDPRYQEPARQSAAASLYELREQRRADRHARRDARHNRRR